MSVLSQKSERSCNCVSEVSSFPLSTAIGFWLSDRVEILLKVALNTIFSPNPLKCSDTLLWNKKKNFDIDHILEHTRI
jgi:hypothetical protein